MPHRILNHCQHCNAAIASYWTHCYDCRMILHAAKVARAKAVAPKPTLPGNDPRDILNFWGTQWNMK